MHKKREIGLKGLGRQNSESRDVICWPRWMEGIPEKECFSGEEMQGGRVTGIGIFEKVVFCVYDENV